MSVDDEPAPPFDARLTRAAQGADIIAFVPLWARARVCGRRSALGEATDQKSRQQRRAPADAHAVSRARRTVRTACSDSLLFIRDVALIIACVAR
eukprot:scaffold27741_cov146-Isochrysis_galbana.AAC.2